MMSSFITTNTQGTSILLMKVKARVLLGQRNCLDDTSCTAISRNANHVNYLNQESYLKCIHSINYICFNLNPEGSRSILLSSFHSRSPKQVKSDSNFSCHVNSSLIGLRDCRTNKDLNEQPPLTINRHDLHFDFCILHLFPITSFQ